MNPIRSLLPLSASLIATTAAAQTPIYIPLSPGSTATDVTVTDTDIVVVGENQSGVFRWTYSSGMESPLGGISSTTHPRVSQDGVRVISTLYVNNTNTASVWDGSAWVYSPSMGSICGEDQTIALGISGNGLTVSGGGYVGPGCTGPHAMAWHWPTTIQDLGGFFSDPASRAFATSQDGTICAGYKDMLNGQRRGARWVNGTYSALGWVDPGTMIPYVIGTAQGMNSAGTILVGGTYFNGPPSTARAAWRWDASTGNATVLPNAAPFMTNAVALDTSEDGTTIVGHSGGNVISGTGSVVWFNNAPQELHAYLTGLGTAGISSYSTLGFVMACSRDGQVLCGFGSGTSGTQPLNGWVVILPGALQVGTTFCAGDGSAAACPCANPGTAGHGCANSVNASGARLTASGQASLSNDSIDLQGFGMPNSSALYFQGTSQLNGGQGSAFGDGLRCAAGSVIRLGTKTNVNGMSQYPVGSDPSVSVRGMITLPGTREYQIWYRNADPTFCTAATFNLSNGLQLNWGT